ncbi:hypothetical protein HDU67_001493 [Dinochytrium kinnereticum]|nr:hypothetical protein HDU67_001493 [Dinochytrium kinnereticum]
MGDGWSLFIPLRSSWDALLSSRGNVSETITVYDETIARRLRNLEKRLEDVLYRVSSDSKNVAAVSSLTDETRRGIVTIEERIRELGKRVDQVLADQSGHTDEVVGVLTRTVLGVREDVEELRRRVLEGVGEVRGVVGGVEKRVASLEGLAGGAGKGLSREEVEKRVVELVRREVPSLMVARVGEGGQVEVDGNFLGYLKGRFAEREEVEEVQGSVGRALEGVETALGGLRRVEEEVGRVDQDVQESKKDVPAAPGVSVEEVRRIFDEQTGTLMTRPDVEGIIEKAKTEIHHSFNKVLTTKADSETLTLIIDELDFLQTNKARLTALLSNDPPPSTTLLTRDETLQLLTDRLLDLRASIRKDVEDSEESVRRVAGEVVGRALERFWKGGEDGGVGRPDYALASAGGFVVHALTSEGLYGGGGGWVGRLVGVRRPRGFGPGMALTPGTLPGKCWSMEGSSGHLGIHLARRITPHAFTIDHLHPTLSLDPTLSSAPKDIELWAVSDVRRFKSLDWDSPSARGIPKPGDGGEKPAGVLMAVQRFEREDGVRTFAVREEVESEMVE